MNVVGVGGAGKWGGGGQGFGGWDGDESVGACGANPRAKANATCTKSLFWSDENMSAFLRPSVFVFTIGIKRY